MGLYADIAEGFAGLIQNHNWASSGCLDSDGVRLYVENNYFSFFYQQMSWNWSRYRQSIKLQCLIFCDFGCSLFAIIRCKDNKLLKSLTDLIPALK